MVMKRSKLLYFFAILEIAILTMGQGCQNRNNPYVYQETISTTFQGRKRQYIVHISPKRQHMIHPVLLVLHGGGKGDAQDMIDKNRYDEIGDSLGYITVFPDGVFSDWADGRGVTNSEKAGVNDVDFIKYILDELIHKYKIDEQRIFICGVSNGGMMVQRLACEIPDRFAGFASIIASMPDSVFSHCTSSVPVNMLMMCGTKDPLIPYEGGLLGSLTDGGSVIGARQTFNFWNTQNDCLGPQIGQGMDFPDIDISDHSTVILYKAIDCEPGSASILYEIVGGGHVPPGYDFDANPIPFLGYINKDIITEEEVFGFFESR